LSAFHTVSERRIEFSYSAASLFYVFVAFIGAVRYKLGKLIMLDFEPLNPAGGRNPRKAAIPEEKYIFVHINSR
jgi:hypothetical protein